MTIRSVGYDGSIGEVDWSRWLAPYLGSAPGVAGPGDFRVTRTTGMSVQVAPGTAHGHGITDVSDAAETLQLETVTSGVRWDAIVLRRSWAGTSTTPSGVATGGRTSVAYVKGGSAQALPTLASSGSLYEQPLALVKVSAGSTTVQDVEDLRATHAKAAYARSMLAMTGPPGTRYTLEPDGRRYVMVVDPASGTSVPKVEWEPPAPVMPDVTPIRSGTAFLNFNSGFGEGVGAAAGRQRVRPPAHAVSPVDQPREGLPNHAVPMPASASNAVAAKATPMMPASW